MPLHSLNQQLATLFPNRPIQVRSEWDAFRWPIFLLLLWILLRLGSYTFGAAGSLMGDLPKEKVEPIEAKIEAQCSPLIDERRGILSSHSFLDPECRFIVTPKTLINGEPKQINYYGKRLSREEIEGLVALQAIDEPQKITLNLLQEKRKVRLIALIERGATLLVVLYIFLRLSYNLWNQKRGEGVQYRLEALPFTTSRSTFIRYHIINYHVIKEGREGRRHKTTFSQNEGPILLPVEGDERTFALGIVPIEEGNHPPLLLDKKLKRVALTDEERASLLKALSPYL